MSLTLSNVQQTEFDELVKMEYRSLGFLLRDTIRLRTDVVGNTCNFRKVGQVIAQQQAYQNTIAIQDPGFSSVSATLLKYAAGTAVDEIQDLTVNFDSKKELAMVVAAAIGRRSDQIIINCLNNSGTSNTIAAGAANMSYSKLRAIVEYFEDLAVPPEERFLALSANNLRALLADDQVISNRYTDNYAVEKGTLNRSNLMGMNIRVIPTMTEGGLPKTGNIRTAFAWHKMSSGFAVGMDMRTEINYLPRETSWFVNGLFFGGAAAVDTRGIIAISCDESVNP